MNTMPKLIAFLATSLFAAGAARAESWSSRVADAASVCRGDASTLRTLAADCRLHSEPPPEGGEYCPGITRTEPAPDGSMVEYQLSPADADALADRFDGHAPALDAAAAELAELEAAVAETQDKIRELGFEKRNEDYEVWLELAESARAELTEQTRSLLIEGAFESAERLTGGIARLSRGKAQKMADRLARYGEPGVAAGKRLKRVARITGRRAKAEAAGEALEGLRAVYDEVSGEDDAYDLEALADALTEVVDAEGFGFLVEELKWTTAAAFAAAAGTVAESQIDRLTEMQELHLRALKSLTQLLERQVARVRARVLELRPCRYAPPVG